VTLVLGVCRNNGCEKLATQTVTGQVDLPGIGMKEVTLELCDKCHKEVTQGIIGNSGFSIAKDN
jgi:hypothetical protein